MDRFALALVLIAGLAGVFFLGQGITGHAVSETCCIGPTCSAVSQCNSLQPELQAPTVITRFDIFTLGLGLLALAGCLLALLFIGREHRSH